MNYIRKHLLEGIVVVLVLIVLLVVMMPWFLNSQVRWKVTKTLSHLEHTRQAFNSYLLDHSSCPIDAGNITLVTGQWLTTPVSYLETTNYLLDPCTQPGFLKAIELKPQYLSLKVNEKLQSKAQYILYSCGPSDGIIFEAGGVKVLFYRNSAWELGTSYSPSNGTISLGYLYATAQGVVPVE